MNEQETTTATWNVLRDFGFQIDDDVIYDAMPGLSFDFGNFKLSACWVMNRRFANVVMLTGVLVTQRTLADVCFEMPRSVESHEQCAAWIAWNLDNSAGKCGFLPARETPWLEMGRQNHRSLPWVADLEAYQSRPICMVDRDWLRMALKTLKEVLADVGDDTRVAFSFDGSVLKISCNGKIVAMAAKGKSWPQQYLISSDKLKRLPKRIMGGVVGISVWKDQLHIGRNCYSGVMVNIAEEN